MGVGLPTAGVAGAFVTAGTFDAAEVCAGRLYGMRLKKMRRNGTVHPESAGRCANTKRRVRSFDFGCRLTRECLLLHSYRPKPRIAIGVPGKARCDPHAHMEKRAGDSVTC